MNESIFSDPELSSTGETLRREGRGVGWEIGALALALLGIYVAVALLVAEDGARVVGKAGVALAGALHFLFGIFVAFAVPGVLLTLAVLMFLGRRAAVGPGRLLGFALLIPAVAGMLALPFADEAEYRTETMRRAGAVGTFMVEWDGLQLASTLGTVGAAMVLLSMAMVGLVLATNAPMSTLAMRGVELLGGRPAPRPRRTADAPPADPPTARSKASGAAAAKSAAPLLPLRADQQDDDDVSLLDEAPPRGFLGRLFGRRDAVLGAPDPEESREQELPHGYDADALAAAAALEAARIDEEYERALMEEERRAEAGLHTHASPPSSGLLPKSMDELIEQLSAPGMDDIDDEVAAEARIVFRAPGEPAPAEVMRGNPCNVPGRDAMEDDDDDAWDFDAENDLAEDEEEEEEEDVAPPTPGRGPALGDELARMFPTRWAKDGDQLNRSSAPPNRPASPEQIRDRAEERALRLAGPPAPTAQRATAPWEDPAAGEEHEWGAEGEDDPLFDENLETRPAGVEAAMAEARVSALERDLAAARLNKQLAAYRLPDIELLDDPPKVDNQMSREEMLEMSATLEKTFADFNIKVKVVEVKQGPVVTRFEMKPAPGIKVSKIVGLEHDIAMAMRAVSVRIVAPIPGKAAVGIEIPNKNRAGVYFRELVSTREFWDHSSPLAFALGKTIEGAPYYADLKKMPHLLIAGATGAGKSVCLNTIICSLLYRQRPDRLRMLMVDPKRVEMAIYQNIPHLISPVICEAKSAAAALAWAVEQMEERYKKLVEFSVRNIDGYNAIATDPAKQGKFRGKNMDVMPHMVIIVDELADLMVVAKNEVEESIQRLAQMARAVGMHLILATQRPSVNVITGIIKANFPTRIAFQVSQKVDSRTILDANGAECLLGRGDMLFAPAGAGKPIRVQGAFLSDEEVERVADYTRAQMPPMFEVEEFEPLLSEKEQKELAKLMGHPTSMDDLDAQDRMARGTNRTMGKVTAGMFLPHEGGSAQAGEDEIDEALVRAAAKLILEARKGSTSLVQRRLKVGFARAGRLMDMLEEMGIVGPYKGSKPRDILVDPDAALEQLERLEQSIADNGGNSRKAADGLDYT